MTPPIKIYISPNETVTGKERIAAMQPYLLRHVKEFEVHTDLEMGSDLVFVKTICHEVSDTHQEMTFKRLAVELKRPLDYAESCRNGHMATQRRDCQYPLVVWVLGSMGDVMRELPMISREGWQSHTTKEKYESMVLRSTASLRASGVEVRFGSSWMDFMIQKDWQYRPQCELVMAVKKAETDALEANMTQVLREAKAYLESDYHLPMPTCEDVKSAMLQCLRGVGPKIAEQILNAGIRPLLMPPGGRLPIGVVTCDDVNDTLLESLMSIDGIGKVTAQKILEAMRSG